MCFSQHCKYFVKIVTPSDIMVFDSTVSICTHGGPFLNICSVFRWNIWNLYISSLQGSASESTLLALLAARNKVLKRLKSEFPDTPETELLSKLTCYASEQVKQHGQIFTTIVFSET